MKVNSVEERRSHLRDGREFTMNISAVWEQSVLFLITSVKRVQEVIVASVKLRTSYWSCLFAKCCVSVLIRLLAIPFPRRRTSWRFLKVKDRLTDEMEKNKVKSSRLRKSAVRFTLASIVVNYISSCISFGSFSKEGNRENNFVCITERLQYKEVKKMIRLKENVACWSLDPAGTGFSFTPKNVLLEEKAAPSLRTHPLCRVRWRILWRAGTTVNARQWQKCLKMSGQLILFSVNFGPDVTQNCRYKIERGYGKHAPRWHYSLWSSFFYPPPRHTWTQFWAQIFKLLGVLDEIYKSAVFCFFFWNVYFVDRWIFTGLTSSRLYFDSALFEFANMSVIGTQLNIRKSDFINLFEMLRISNFTGS